LQAPFSEKSRFAGSFFRKGPFCRLLFQKRAVLRAPFSEKSRFAGSKKQPPQKTTFLE
jgi:hypothetical protein